MYNPVINFVLFQIGWFACVLGGAHNYPAIGSFVALFIIACHLFFANEWYLELLLVISAMILGFAWDSYLVYQKWISYSHGQFSPDTAPYWIVVMWGLFTTTLNVSLNWLKTRLVYSVMFGAIGGPLAYYAGARLGALEFTAPTNALIALSVGWAIFTPVLLHLTNHLNGFRKAEQRSPT
jgi:hypothetical protein